MARRQSSRSKHRYFSKIAWLDRHDFDIICKNKLQYDSSRYRLERDPYNKFDKNAIRVYVNQFIIGYLYKDTAKELAPMMDRGDVFSVKHHQSSFSGDYRRLTIRIYNESAIAFEEGNPLDDQTAFDMMAIHCDSEIITPKKQQAHSEPKKGVNGCVIVFIIGVVIFLLLKAI